jgi:predicted phosphoribosyltransferase
MVGTIRAVRIVPWIPQLFSDRAEAGRALAKTVAALEHEEPVVVGVARGGVAVAVEVADAIRAPLTAVDVERVNAHGLRLGAVAAQGPPCLREGHNLPGVDVDAASKVPAARTRCSRHGSSCRRLRSPDERRCSSTTG